ncbi:hypothetical protein ACSFB8_07375 [Enterococcus faecalis]
MANLEEFYQFLQKYPEKPIEGGIPIEEKKLPDYMYQDPERYPEEVFNLLSEIAKGDYIGRNYYTLIKNILNKEWGVDVRATLALSVYLNGMTLMTMAQNLVDCENTQEDLEKAVVGLEKKFENVLTGVTKDSEVIDARMSLLFGEFPVLSKRLENIERAIYSLVPHGTLLKIKRTVSSQPFVTTRKYTFGLGMVPIGTEPEGAFGGTIPEVFPNELISWDNDVIVVRIPEEYADYAFVYRPDHNEYILNKNTEGIIVTIQGGEPVGSNTDTNQLLIEKENNNEKNL